MGRHTHLGTDDGSDEPVLMEILLSTSTHVASRNGILPENSSSLFGLRLVVELEP